MWMDAISWACHEADIANTGDNQARRNKIDNVAPHILFQSSCQCFNRFSWLPLIQARHVVAHDLNTAFGVYENQNLVICDQAVDTSSWDLMRTQWSPFSAAFSNSMSTWLVNISTIPTVSSAFWYCLQDDKKADPGVSTNSEGAYTDQIQSWGIHGSRTQWLTRVCNLAVLICSREPCSSPRPHSEVLQ